jgi:hypothetical protein
MDQEAANPEFAEMSDFDEEEGIRCWSLVFEVLRALRKGRGGGWACVGGMCASVTATLQCDGHHSRVSAPRFEVQTPIRKRDRHHREGKERRHDTRTHGQERGGWCNMACFAVRRSLFSLVQNRV